MSLRFPDMDLQQFAAQAAEMERQYGVRVAAFWIQPGKTGEGSWKARGYYVDAGGQHIRPLTLEQGRVELEWLGRIVGRAAESPLIGASMLVERFILDPVSAAPVMLCKPMMEAAKLLRGSAVELGACSWTQKIAVHERAARRSVNDWEDLEEETHQARARIASRVLRSSLQRDFRQGWTERTVRDLPGIPERAVAGLLDGSAPARLYPAALQALCAMDFAAERVAMPKAVMEGAMLATEIRAAYAQVGEHAPGLAALLGSGKVGGVVHDCFGEQHPCFGAPAHPEAEDEPFLL